MLSGCTEDAGDNAGSTDAREPRAGPPPPPEPRGSAGRRRAGLTSPAGAAIGCGRRSPKRRRLRSPRSLRAAAALSARGARALLAASGPQAALVTLELSRQHPGHFQAAPASSPALVEI
ncbi:uncharacterized protein C11orf87 homolog isoform X2 [Cuculus canorus]|uniref:uncharacterized protein C11orf87 homolog isoform X2 n=1 Tax=Cuculus canorus TaxID=55661 RepID=UPI0023AA3A18|nr:uncharacterized protein C11orf87 homolog isoform X2 [Cuculus canorus]